VHGPAATPKMLAVELARFIGLRLPSRFSQVEWQHADV
jgi:hypothetical protein